MPSCILDCVSNSLIPDELHFIIFFSAERGDVANRKSLLKEHHLKTPVKVSTEVVVCSSQLREVMWLIQNHFIKQ